jgi:uncharacterized MAPEG superfamily protein
MAWVDIVALLAVVQLVVFGVLVGRARGTCNIAAPATTGHPVFERYYRVQMNTVECMIAFLPALWLAARYWSPRWAALLGAVYLVGRVLYLISYVQDPKKRSLGFSISVLPILVMTVAALLGAIRAAMAG